MSKDDIVSSANEHGGRYLISRSDWRNKEGDYDACAKLVSSGQARWLGIASHASEGYGEPGPGIQLLGPKRYFTLSGGE